MELSKMRENIQTRGNNKIEDRQEGPAEKVYAIIFILQKIKTKTNYNNNNKENRNSETCFKTRVLGSKSKLVLPVTRKAEG